MLFFLIDSWSNLHLFPYCALKNILVVGVIYILMPEYICECFCVHLFMTFQVGLHPEKGGLHSSLVILLLLLWLLAYAPYRFIVWQIKFSCPVRCMTQMSLSLLGRLLFYNILYSQVSLGSTERSAQHEDFAWGRCPPSARSILRILSK